MGHRGQSAQAIDALSEEEYKAAAEVLECFYIAAGRSKPSKIHLDEECQTLTRKNTKHSVRPKGTDVFPYGFHSVCRYCTISWRESVRLMAGVASFSDE